MDAGHRRLPHTADFLIEAWGSDLASCLVEALSGMVEAFVEVPDGAGTSPLPIALPPSSAEDALVALLEEVIYDLDVFGVVPVRVHLTEGDDGGIAGAMEVVPVSQAAVVGPAPKGIAYHELSIAPEAGRWRCHVLVDV